MYAYSGILTALLQRATSGRVSPVEVSLFDALAEWMGAPAYFTRYGGTSPGRAGAVHATIAPYGPFAAADGVVLLAIQNEREWEALCDVVLDEPALAFDERFARNSDRVVNRRALEARITRQFAALTAARVVELLDSAGIANARLNTVEEFLDHPVLRGRGRWSSVGTPNGPIEALRPPADLVGVEPRMGDVPAVGAHTDAILQELGYGDVEAGALRRDGVV